MSSSSIDTSLMSVAEYYEFLTSQNEEIESAPNNFTDENLLTQGTSYKVYKGRQLLQSGDLINIVARTCPEDNVMFNELTICKDLKHKNIVSILMLIENENDEAFIINKHEANGSLSKHLSGSTLTWIRRLHICAAIADALSYIHNDAKDDYSIIHSNIKSSKVLLDENWEPKVHGFGFGVIAKKHHTYLTSNYKGSLQYMDPAYESTKGLTHKSDVFSFGVVLFEVLFGREASTPNNDNWNFARWARLHYEEKKLDDMIDPDLRKQMNMKSFNIFAETAYCCLKEQRSKRPDMNQVLRRLERALEIQRQHEHSTAEGTSSDHLKGKGLEHLKIPLSEIELATNKFSKTHCIGSGGYGMVYKARLEHYDVINSSAIEVTSKDKMPKKHSTVAIKRIFSRVDTQGEQGFLAEIEMLSKCKHPNIISLIGYCDEGPEMILVYEYASNGSLDDYLGNPENITNLTWAQRIQICIDVAKGLDYLHTSTKDKQSIIHRDIKSANILLDDNWVAKIADFGLCKLHHTCQQGSTLVTYNIAGTELYLDPEYLSTGKLKTKSDVYSFGVVLFEIMCGKLAYDKSYGAGLPSIARQCFSDGTLKNLVDPKIKEADEDISMLNGGVNQDSLETFSKIAHQCLAETQSKRPTMKVIIKELENALNLQKNSRNNLHISLHAIKLATQDFSDCNCIGEGRFWKLYEGEVSHANGCSTVSIKRWDIEFRHRHIEFLTEIEILLKYKHENIIGLVGYCNERNEKIIVFKHASNGRLDKHLDNHSLTWVKRLKICINVASGLRFLHSGGEEQENGMNEEDAIKHRDIRSGNILLDGDWNAKISNLALCQKTTVFEKAEHVADNNYRSLGYVDPLCEDNGYLTDRSDIYSLGVILLEILCGRLARGEGCENHSQSLGPLAKRHYDEKGNIDEMIFEGMKEHIVPESMTTFQKVAIQCLDEEDKCSRPMARTIVRRLKSALEFQEDFVNWEPRLPIDYKNIIKMSETPELYDSIKTKKNLYDMFSKGILLQDGKVLFSLGSKGERNEMISARKFSFKNRRSHKWRPLQESRFQRAAKMLDISKLNIQINVTTQFLSPGVNYGAYLIFKFCDNKRLSSKPMYVNLKYKRGDDNMHAYFAKRRDNEWMMIELGRFLSHKEDTCFAVLLESFSQYYCGSGAIYVEGIEFKAFDNVKHEEIEKIEEAQQDSKSKPNKDQLLSPNEVVNEKKHLMLSAKDVLCASSTVNCFHLKPSADSRFEEMIELGPQQVFRISCKVQSQLLSLDTDYFCYLVYKLSEKCRGLHSPVKVRNLLHRNNKDTEVFYFRPPSPWNLQDNNHVPEKREDGWMEVVVSKFNSTSELRIEQIPLNLKLITYEGTMSGLIVCGLEIRPM